jgi:hypothetical protein
MPRAVELAISLLIVLSLVGCDLVDPMRPSPHADTEIFGNLIEVVRDPVRTGIWQAKIHVGVPRALGRAGEAVPTPDVEGGILAVVTVTRDTVVVFDDQPASLEDIGLGTEVVAIPSPGTTSMLGDKEVHLEAAQLMDFATYARWRLPKLDLPNAPKLVNDPSRINTSGVEHAPIPLAGGRVLYFSARLRPPEEADGDWIGAARPGLRPPVEGERSFERSFRTELGDDGWSTPEVVTIPGTEDADQVQVSWVSADEQRCYVTVSDSGEDPWVGIAERTDRGRPWGHIVRFEDLGPGDAFDAVAMVGSPEKTVFATTRQGSGDLFLYDPALGESQPLQPEINTGGLEWGSRVGPADELYFVRGDRQLRFQAGEIGEVRLPGPQRTILIEASPSPDGAWLFMATPKLRPIEFDLDIQVAPIGADGSLGTAIPVDDWRPSS